MLFADLYYRPNDTRKISAEIEVLLSWHKYSDFEFVVQIGKGAEGVVYTVWNKATNLMMILKVLNDTNLSFANFENDWNKDPAMQLRFKSIVD